MEIPPASALPASVPAYAELHCLTNFSFQRGASLPQELVRRAHTLGYSALAITDECSVAGVVRAHQEAKACGLKLLLGAEFQASCAEEGDAVCVVVLAHNLAGWGNLCEFITRARRAAVKGQYRVVWGEARWDLLQDCEVLLDIPIAIKMEAACAISISARDQKYLQQQGHAHMAKAPASEGSCKGGSWPN